MEFEAGLTGPSLSTAFSELQTNLPSYVPTIVLGALAYSALDLAYLVTGGTGQPPMFLYSLIGMFVSLMATAQAWQALSGHAPAQPMPVGGYIVAGFVSGIATLLGLLLLILPGLYLLGRWSLFLAVLQGEGGSGMDSLRRSWALTERDWLAGTLVLILAAIPSFAGGMVGILTEGQSQTTAIVAAVLGNSVAVAGAVWGSIATVALYRLITGGVKQVQDIFG